MTLEIVHDDCPESISDDGSPYEYVDKGEQHEAFFFVFGCTRCHDRIIIRLLK